MNFWNERKKPQRIGSVLFFFQNKFIQEFFLFIFFEPMNAPA